MKKNLKQYMLRYGANHGILMYISENIKAMENYLRPMVIIETESNNPDSVVEQMGPSLKKLTSHPDCYKKNLYLSSSSFADWNGMTDAMPVTMTSSKLKDCVLAYKGIAEKLYDPKLLEYAKYEGSEYDPDHTTLAFSPFIAGDYFMITEHPNDLNVLYMDEIPDRKQLIVPQSDKWKVNYCPYTLNIRTGNLHALGYFPAEMKHYEQNNNPQFKDEVIKILDLLHTLFERESYSLQIELIRKGDRLYLIGVKLFALTQLWSKPMSNDAVASPYRTMGFISGNKTLPVITDITLMKGAPVDYAVKCSMRENEDLFKNLKFVPTKHVMVYVYYGGGKNSAIIHNARFAQAVLRNGGCVVINYGGGPQTQEYIQFSGNFVTVRESEYSPGKFGLQFHSDEKPRFGAGETSYRR